MRRPRASSSRQLLKSAARNVKQKKKLAVAQVGASRATEHSDPDPQSVAKPSSLKWLLPEHASIIGKEAVYIPPSLAKRSEFALKASGLSLKEVKSDTKKLNDFIFTREIEPAYSYRKLGSEERSSDQQTKQYSPSLVYKDRESYAYLAGRMGMTFATTKRVLSMVKQSKPTFSPNTVLDFGSGVGSSVWATDEVFEAPHATYTCVESSQDMINLASKILHNNDDIHTSNLKPHLKELGEDIKAHHPGFDESKVIHYQMLPMPKLEPEYDLVISSFSMSEIPQRRLRKKIVQLLWAHTRDTIVFIESGNHTGFGLIHEIREWLIEEKKSKVMAPCPHVATCPRSPRNEHYERPCHFPVKVRLPKAFRFSEGETSSGTRREKMSYIVFSRHDIKERLPRIIGSVQRRKGHNLFDLCMPVEDQDLKEEDTISGNLGYQRVTVPRSIGKEAWQDSKLRNWGDVFPNYPKCFVGKDN